MLSGLGAFMGNMKTFWIFGYMYWGKSRPGKCWDKRGRCWIPIVRGLWVLHIGENKIKRSYMDYFWIGWICGTISALIGEVVGIYIFHFLL